jgi:LPS sulfotransferase NodH
LAQSFLERKMTKPPEAVRFIILNATRTGSNFLCTVLNSHPGILCHHEIFNPHVIGVARHLQDSEFRLGSMEERESDPVEFLDRVWRTDLGRAAVGFKMCLWQHQPAYDAVVPDASVRKIILKRRNRVKSFVSLLLARQTGEWVVYDDRGAPAPRPRVQVDRDALLENIALHERFYGETEQALRESGQDHVLLWYEDLFLPDGIEPALAFLGAEGRPAQPQGQTWKLAPVALRETIANFDALNEALQGSDLEAELHQMGR